MVVLIDYISAIDQATSPRLKFLPLSLSDIVEYDLKEKEDDKKEDDTKLTVTMTRKALTGDEEEEEESPSKESEEKVDEEKKPDGDADRQGQAPGPGGISFSGMGGQEDGPYKPSITGEDEDENPVFLGLKVYTKEAGVVVKGRVRGEEEDEEDDEQGDEGDDGDDGDENEDE
jgi:hypothetical protein